MYVLSAKETKVLLHQIKNKGIVAPNTPTLAISFISIITIITTIIIIIIIIIMITIRSLGFKNKL